MPADRILRELEQRLRGLLDRVHTQGPLTVTLRWPGPVTATGLAACERGILWRSPGGHGVMRLASGWIPLTTAAGEARFATLEAARQHWRSRWRHLDPDGTGRMPALFCGFAFDPLDPCGEHFAGLPNSLLALPEVLIEREADSRAWLHFSAAERPVDDPGHLVDHWIYRLRPLLTNGRTAPFFPATHPAIARRDDPDAPAAWRQRVHAALREIGQGRLSKVVLSRTRRVPLPAGFRLGWLIEDLLQAQGRSRLFVVRHGGQTLVGLSPECLVRLRSGRVHVEAVGGTRERRRSPTGSDDRTLPLLGAPKLLHEHRLVVEDILARLRPLCERIIHSPTPGELVLADVRHLHTPIEARARKNVRLLTLAEALHPTAATGGLPRGPALAWLRAHGEDRRGWYTGALGWLTPDGEGELTVVLRCGILGQHEARLYAGAGIVAGSVPEEEFRETDWKLRTLIRHLHRASAPPLHSRRTGIPA